MGLRGLLRPVRGRLIVAAAVQAVGSVAALAPLVAVAEVGRAMLGGGGAREAWVWAGVAVVALVLRLSLVLLAGGLAHRADMDLQLALRRRLVAHLRRVPLGWFGTRTSGQVKNAVTDDVAALHHLVGHAVLDIVGAVLTPLLGLAYLVWVDWRLALATLTTLPFFVVAYALMARGHGPEYARYSAAQARVDSAVVEFVHGIAVVKTFGQARRAQRRFVEATDAYAEQMGSYTARTAPYLSAGDVAVSPPVMLLVVLSWSTVFLAQGWVALADVLPFVLLGVGLTAPVLTLGYGASDLRMAREAAARIGALLDVPAQVDGHRLGPDSDDVSLVGVGFRYGQNRALHEVDLQLSPGTVTALVGASGSGKSTLARLVPRFHDPAEGAVLLGGIDLRELAGRDLFTRTGFVFQEVHLLRDTVRANIAMARPSAGADDVERVSRAAQIHDRIMRLPRGYDWVIGDDAVLSGGEAQRVSIARALLADPRVLVLDEATAFADPESEAAVQDALSRLAVGRTVLVVAHRLSTITSVDQVVVLERGRVVERGRHEQLLAAGGHYARMWAAHHGHVKAEIR